MLVKISSVYKGFKRIPRYKYAGIGGTYRFLVVHSSKLDGRKARSLERQYSKRKKTLEKEIKNKMKETYVCMPDAEAALKQFIKKHADKHFHIKGQVIAEVKKKARPALQGQPYQYCLPPANRSFA